MNSGNDPFMGAMPEINGTPMLERTHSFSSVSGRKDEQRAEEPKASLTIPISFAQYPVSMALPNMATPTSVLPNPVLDIAFIAAAVLRSTPPSPVDTIDPHVLSLQPQHMYLPLSHLESELFMILASLHRPTALTEFKLFGKLPPDLRFMIWGLTLTPRTIEMRFTKHNGYTQYDFLSSKVPTMLQVHFESRQWGQRLYGPRFGSKYSKFPAYFHSSLDALHLRDTYIDFSHGLKHITATLQHMLDKDAVKYLSVSKEVFSEWSLKKVYVYFVINRHAYYFSGAVKHTGHCRHKAKGRLCFVSCKRVKFVPNRGQATRPAFSTTEKKVLVDSTKDFIKKVDKKKWKGIEWEKPEFRY
ncbi:hypothetical protein EG329_011587 [Mollisiaceae sp. DMI_Dod_QoI]|nr:hypothetical protein EG329_011587 [Helotiales sp. DMI_Dod_QoI]